MSAGDTEAHVSKRPSMMEVARLAGVSHQTVSRVINLSPNVSEATRAKVQAAIASLGYQPSNSARALASSRSRTVGLIAGKAEYPGLCTIIASIEKMARTHGLFLSLMLVDERACAREEFESVCNNFLRLNVDAFIFLTPTDEMFEAACTISVCQPRIIVTSTHGKVNAGELLGRNADEVKIACTGIDHWSAMQEIGRLLAIRGHRTALYLAGPGECRDAATRLDSWQQAAKHYRIRTAVVQSQTWQARESYALMNRLIDERGMRGSALPSVVVTASDNQAVGASRALYEHGLRIPQDISLVGFGDIATADSMNPPLTTVRPRFADLGTVAMRQLLSLIDGGQQIHVPLSRHGFALIGADVVIRSSLGYAIRR